MTSRKWLQKAPEPSRHGGFAFTSQAWLGGRGVAILRHYAFIVYLHSLHPSFSTLLQGRVFQSQSRASASRPGRNVCCTPILPPQAAEVKDSPPSCPSTARSCQGYSIPAARRGLLPSAAASAYHMPHSLGRGCSIPPVPGIHRNQWAGRVLSPTRPTVSVF